MDTLLETIDQTHDTDANLVLIVGKPGSGKSKMIKEYSKNTGIPIVDFSKVLAGDPEDLKDTLNKFLKNYRFDVLLIDNKDALYRDKGSADLKDILEALSEVVTVVATWNGTVDDGELIHIVKGEQKSYPIDGSFKYVLV